MEAFGEALWDASLDDLGSIGFPFTWFNGRVSSANIQERLDRFVANKEWVDRFFTYQVRHLIR